MKTNLKWITALALALLGLISCQKDNDLEGNQDLLMGCWTHSLEEDSISGIETYRRCDYKDFAPTWFRQTYILRENQECDYLVLAPNDAHFIETGSWLWDEESRMLNIIGENGEELKIFQIDNVTDTLWIGDVQ
jgi:hypothetical protein